MATLATLSDRVRLELGDQASTFDVTLTADGTSVRYEIGLYPVDGTTLQVRVAGTLVPDANVGVEERTGILVFATPPAANAAIRVSGTKYRYFGSADMAQFVNDAVSEHLHHRTDAFGRSLTLNNLDLVEEYPASLLATTFALYALATDASFDIDIHAPDGVSIPRSERYRQLMDMLAVRQQQYRDLCAALNIGLNRIEVFQLRRVSRTTNRLVPIYVAQEIDDSTMPQRVYLPSSTLGAEPFPQAATRQDFTVTQGDRFAAVLDLPVPTTAYKVEAQIRLYPGTAAIFASIFCTSPYNGDPTKVRIELMPAVTLGLPPKAFWDLQLTSTSDPTDITTYYTGMFFVPRQVTSSANAVPGVLMPANYYAQDPDATLDYTWSWAEWLDPGETISTFSFTAPAGVTLSDTMLDGATTVAWVHSTVLGEIPVTCHITTSAGRVDDRTIYIIVANR